MTLPKWTLGLGTWGLGLLLALGGSVRAEEQADPEAGQPGVEVQGRGPVHEAYAEPGVNRPAPPVVAKKPPDPVDEMPPDQKPEGDNVQWIPGYWAFDDATQDFLWVSGCWRAIPPGKQWMPGHWSAVANGFQWVPGFWADAGQQEAALVAAPPPASIDVGPSAPAPGPDSIYVPGNWVFRETRYAWRPGFWYVPKPGWVWVPARYVWTPGGWIFVEGYWDYPLEQRGLLFAPVAIDVRYRHRPRWVYRPRVIVYDTALVGCLFVRPVTGTFYFGDYFDPRYRTGLVAWVDFHPTRYRLGYDPLFTYLRWRHRDDRLWVRNVRTLYAGRYNGTVVRPPLTLVQQTTVLRTRPANARHVTVLAPISRVDRTVVKVRPVPPAQIALERKSVQQLRAVGVQRQQITARAVVKGPTPTAPRVRPPVTRVELPKVTPVIKPKVVVKPPALPRGARPPVKPEERRDRR